MNARSKPAKLGTVLCSINAWGETLCVDFFRREDGTIGFEEYRRDVETGQGWFPIGFHSGKVFADLKSAKTAALRTVVWLQGEL